MNQFFRTMLAAFGGLLVTGSEMACLSGCQANSEPMERSFNTLMMQVVKPAVDKALTEVKTQTSTLQGGVEAINPGFVIEGYAHFTGTGIIYKTTVYAIGLAGRIEGFAQGSNPDGWDQSGKETDETPKPELESVEPVTP